MHGGASAFPPRIPPKPLTLLSYLVINCNLFQAQKQKGEVGKFSCFFFLRIISSPFFVFVLVTSPQSQKRKTSLRFFGVRTINIFANPKALAGWYTEKLGLDASSEYHGFYYGSFSTKSGDFNLGIHPIPAGAKVGTPNISITFRVSDFKSYTSDLRSRGLVPIREENDASGHFFTLKDLDGNEVTIWGE